MDFTKDILGNGTRLYVYQSDLYTHTSVDFNFYSQRDESNAAKTLVNMVMMGGSKNFPTNQELSLAAEKEFGAILMNKSTVIGDLHTFGFYLDILTKESLISGQKTLENTISLLADIIQNPLINDGKFNENDFERKKEELLLGIKKEKLDKGTKAALGFLKLVFGDAKCVYPKNGTEEDVEKLENFELVKLYHNWMSSLPRAIYVGTHLNSKYIKEVFEKSFDTLPKCKGEAHIEKTPKKNLSTFFEEQDSFDQTVVYAGVPVKVPKKKEDREALNLLNFYLGGYTNARLFTEIRTKRDMAYGAYSHLDLHKSLMFGTAGVDIENKDKTVDIMLNEIGKVASGKITKSGFKEAKNYLLNLRLMSLHTKGKRLDFIEESLLSGWKDQIKDFETAYTNVNYEDVVRVASLIKNEPIVYCLLQGGRK
ncbi:MAG: insulinase family protein [Nanoarchaeota archaeon]|nr:insulinase family protein [Nanoarchaeota archaeon]MBU4242455.1 insulinase family protein [Nanoarchaeota archaeon]MBU4352428.1 insulinase family protein [Nanoarchaeota archaeon]